MKSKDYGSGPAAHTTANEQLPSIRHQFTSYFVITLVLSFVGTVTVWGASMFFLMKNDSLLRPANYYEQQIPAIIQFGREHGDRIVSTSFQHELEKVIPLEGMDYQMTDVTGRVLYGSLSDQLLLGAGAVTDKVNTTDAIDGSIVTYHPVADEDGQLSGVLVLSYRLTLLSSNPTATATVLLFVAVNSLAPFIFIFGFTLLFARRFGRRLDPSVNRLIAAAERIRHHDLNFRMDNPGGTRELAQLAAAFEQMRSALHTSLQAQWQSEQERRDMVAAVVHDLQTPLTVIGGLVDNLLANEQKRSERLDGYLVTIRNNAGRVIGLVHEMQRLADVDRPDFTVSGQPLALHDFFREKLEQYRPVCEVVGVDLTLAVQVAAGHDGIVIVDARRLEQILTNLTENSLRVTPPGGQIRWDVELSRQRLRLHVCDSGPGFSTTDLRHLFERFYQGAPPRARGQGRMGLGLFIVKTVAEKHGGSVRADNRPGGGACVTVELREIASREQNEVISGEQQEVAPRRPVRVAAIPSHTSRPSTATPAGPSETDSSRRH